ncbi:Alpha/Beta hydrolase protein [Scheffersomyces amazonensis]|uniref:Alpha/Beta hydrolase protein n=1 Tax=Scheffersomyces amazonensis TaxID=1078765 RepID=UPI00315DF717
MYTLQADYSFAGGIPPAPYTIDKSVIGKLDPVYVEFYKENLSQNSKILYTHRVPLKELREGGNVIPGQTPLVEMAKTFDISIPGRAGSIPARVFVPKGPVPTNGWPCFLWFHGGGHVLGNISTENSFCTHIADSVKALVVSVDYRLAPDHPFPAAPNDSYDSLLWVYEFGTKELGIDVNNITVGGSSAGGNLAAVISHKFVNDPKTSKYPPIKLQVLIVPVTDCTADASNTESWKEFEFTPQLPAEKMLWYRTLYLPNSEDLVNVEASPLFYSDESFAKNPPCIVAVAECDVLKSEGIKYGEKLRKNGVKTDINIYPGMPHPVMVMDGVTEQGRQLLKDVSTAIKNSIV